MFNVEFVLAQDRFEVEFGSEKTFEVGGMRERVVTVEKDYEKLINKPRIEGIELEGDKTFEDLSLAAITANDIDDIIVS